MKHNYLFADFLNSETSYLKLQRTWQELITHIATAHGYTLTPYMELEQAGRPIRDGNPLLALRIPETGQGIRIIQTAPATAAGDLGAWFDTFGAGEATETAELVIDIQTTPITFAVAAILIEQWLNGRLSPAGLERWLLPWLEEEE
jgi:hypothetical protein